MIAKRGVCASFQKERQNLLLTRDDCQNEWCLSTVICRVDIGTVGNHRPDGILVAGRNRLEECRNSNAQRETLGFVKRGSGGGPGLFYERLVKCGIGKLQDSRVAAVKVN